MGDRLKIAFKSLHSPTSDHEKVEGYFHYNEEHYFVIFTDRGEVYNEETKEYEYELQGNRVLIPFDNVLFITGPITI